MRIWKTYCVICDEVTPHTEDPVPDKESATVWHCLFCGTWFRPFEPGSPNEPSRLIPPDPVRPIGKEVICSGKI
jgi:hypothetical protein